MKTESAVLILAQFKCVQVIFDGIWVDPVKRYWAGRIKQPLLALFLPFNVHQVIPRDYWTHVFMPMVKMQPNALF